MKIFVYEHVTGGGMASRELSPTLAREADLIARSLVADLLAVPGVTVVASRDPRLPAFPGAESILPRTGESPAALFQRGLEMADAVWPTAPETDGLLEHLARETLARQRILLGCRPDAIRIAASKYATARRLRESGTPVVETCRRGDVLPAASGAWVVKPDDGAGCEGARRVADWQAARRQLDEGSPVLIAQPWVEGEPRSLSLLCAEGRARVLSVNQQRVRTEDDVPVLESLRVNVFPARGQEEGLLAARIAAAVPGLWGCVGVDFVATPGGPVVLEINPRLTTSFSALRQATGLNAPAMVLGLVEPDRFGAGSAVCHNLLVEIPLERACVH